MWRKELFHFALVCLQFAPSRMNEWRIEMKMEMLQWHAQAYSLQLWAHFVPFFQCRTECFTQRQQKKQKQDTKWKRKRVEITPVGTVLICLPMQRSQKEKNDGKRGYYFFYPLFRCDVPFAQKRKYQAEPSAVCNWFASLVWHQLKLLMLLL